MGTPRRARLTGLVVLVVTFVVGTLTGAATLQVLSADDTPVQDRPGSRRGPPDFLARLDLTPEQRVAVDAVLERRRAQMESFWNEHRPQLRAIADSARVEVRAVLTPEQRELEEKFHAERQQQRKREGR